MAHDIIGDIHGHADKLEAVLNELGYRRENVGGAVAHRHPEPNRTALFVGDFIDRGPRQLDTVNTVRAMVEAGSAQAVMGNHELNAVSWHTPSPHNPGEFMRPRGGHKGAQNLLQHSAFLSEVEHDPKLHQELVDWFKTLPLWLDLPGVRVVHACWDARIQNELSPILTPDHCINPGDWIDVCSHGSDNFSRVEILTKGLELDLPAGLNFLDSEGISRKTTRIRWWDESATTYRDLAIMPGGEEIGLPLLTAPRDKHPIYDHAKPLFFGHYWFTGKPEPLNPSIACVDYSAAKNDGPLVAYRWDGEKDLTVDKFLAVGGRPLILRP